MAQTTTNLGLTKPAENEMAEVSAINGNSDILDSAVHNNRQNFAPVINGSTATFNVSAGQYIVWNGVLCVADSDISSGDTLATSGAGANLTNCANGIANELSEQKVNNNEMGIVVDGNKTSYASGASIGQYIILRNSTITGCDDGLYTAAKAIPYNTVIDNTYLTAVSGGGLNSLNSKQPIRLTHETYNSISTSWGSIYISSRLSVNISGYGFTEPPFVIATMNPKSSTAWVIVDSVSKDGIEFYLARGNSASAGYRDVNFLIYPAD